MNQYIPDLTERFPEGFGGVDMTSRYFPSKGDVWYDWDALDKYDDFDIPNETEESSNETKSMPKVFAVGQRYEWTSWFTGGVSYLTVKEIKNSKLTFSEYRMEIDGEYEIEESFDIAKDENGDEYIVMCEYRGEISKLYAEEVN